LQRNQIKYLYKNVPGNTEANVKFKRVYVENQKFNAVNLIKSVYYFLNLTTNYL
jgi:hypothetical protein